MDDKQLATAAFQFLQRTQVQGSEVPVFVNVMRWLELKINGVPEMPTMQDKANDALPEKHQGANGETQPDI